MEIAAYKDPATGKLFETPGALADFQGEQRKAAEKAARIAEIRTRLTALRTVVASSMKAPADLCTLVRDAYQEALDLMQEMVELLGIKRTKAEQKKIAVAKVEAWNFDWIPGTTYTPESGLFMQCTLAVTLTDEPYRKLFCEEMPNLDFETVISGMRSSGGSSSTDDSDGTYRKTYTVKFPLKNLPRMYPRVVELAEVSEARTKHGQSLQLAQLRAFNENPEVHAISAELAAAESAVEEALKARKAVQDRLDQKNVEIAAAVAQEMPFEQQSRLDAALDGFGSEKNVDWQACKFYL